MCMYVHVYVSVRNHKKTTNSKHMNSILNSCRCSWYYFFCLFAKVTGMFHLTYQTHANEATGCR